MRKVRARLASLTGSFGWKTVPAKEIAALPAPRKRIVETISRLARASNFRDQIVSAYDQRCAVTRVQLKLVDAAHILPVGAEGSTDSVRNGICLAPTYHRAFDSGLIYLTPKLQMQSTRPNSASSFHSISPVALISSAIISTRKSFSPPIPSSAQRSNTSRKRMPFEGSLDDLTDSWLSCRTYNHSLTAFA